MNNRRGAFDLIYSLADTIQSGVIKIKMYSLRILLVKRKKEL